MADAKQILDTTSGDTGAAETFSNDELNLNKNIFFQCEIGSGDTVVVEGRLDSTLSYVVLETMTADTLKQIKVPNTFRARRTVDGGSEDSQVWIQTLDSSRGL